MIPQGSGHGGLTLKRDKEKDGEINVDNGVEGDEGDHGDAPHADDANSVLDLGNSAGGRLVS